MSELHRRCYRSRVSFHSFFSSDGCQGVAELILLLGMTRQVIQKAMAQKPFRRFSVRLTDGELVQIKGEHTAAIHPKGKTILIFDDDGGYRIIDLALITELQTA